MTAFPIRFDYDKRVTHPVGYGYDARPDTPLIGIVYHSTEGTPHQTFADLAAYLRDAPDKSAHYLVGRDGTIQRILDPGLWRAWHAGYSYFAHIKDWNDCAVGIECEHRAGQDWPAIQCAGLAALARQLVADHPTIIYHVRHADIATNPYDEWPPIKYGRKTDPTDWPPAQFQAWITSQVLHRG